MRDVYQLAVSIVERRYWQLLALLLFTFVLGVFLWYPKDSSETYFKQYEMDATPGLTLPWWQIELAARDVLKLPVSLPKQVPDGRWFLEVLGHPIGSETSGTLDIGGTRLRVDGSRGPLWHRVYLDGPPKSGTNWFRLRYRPGSRGDEDARFRIWGRSTKNRIYPRLSSKETPESTVGDILVPISFRQENVEPDHLKNWTEQQENLTPTPFFRLGVQTRTLGSKRVGSALISLSLGLLALLLLFRFAVYSIQHPGFGLGVLVIGAAAGWLRYAHLSSLSDLLELTGNGLTVRDGVSWDSAAYLSDAAQIFSNEVAVNPALVWPIGMPTFSAFLFHWSGIDLQVPKSGFAVLQALVGPLLFFCCLPAVRNKLLAFLPLLTWSLFFRPMKYSYFFLAETLTLCLMIGWIAILFSRDPRRRDPQWLWIVLSCSILFGLATYTRDVVVTFLPAFLGMVAVFLGSKWQQKLISAGCALGIVVALWCATPVLFSDKQFSLRPAAFLPVTVKHYRTPNRLGTRDSDAIRRLPPIGPEEFGLSPVLRNVVEQARSRPTAYLGERYEAAKRFWDPKQRWKSKLSDDPSYRESFFARLVEGDLKRGASYGALIAVLLSTAVFGLFFSLRWVALSGFFLYVTLFHVLLFPGFTARPKAIFFPFVVLFASAGVFAFVEGFAPWLGRKIAAGRGKVQE